MKMPRQEEHMLWSLNISSRIKLEPLDNSDVGDGFASKDVMNTSSFGVFPTSCSLLDDFIISKTLFSTLDSEFVGLLDSTIKNVLSQAEFTLWGHDVGCQVSAGDVTPSSTSSIYESIVAIGN